MSQAISVSAEDPKRKRRLRIQRSCLTGFTFACLGLWIIALAVSLFLAGSAELWHRTLHEFYGVIAAVSIGLFIACIVTVRWERRAQRARDLERSAAHRRHADARSEFWISEYGDACGGVIDEIGNRLIAICRVAADVFVAGPLVRAMADSESRCPDALLTTNHIPQVAAGLSFINYAGRSPRQAGSSCGNLVKMLGEVRRAVDCPPLPSDAQISMFDLGLVKQLCAEGDDARDFVELQITRIGTSVDKLAAMRGELSGDRFTAPDLRMGEVFSRFAAIQGAFSGWNQVSRVSDQMDAAGYLTSAFSACTSIENTLSSGARLIEQLNLMHRSMRSELAGLPSATGVTDDSDPIGMGEIGLQRAVRAVATIEGVDFVISLIRARPFDRRPVSGRARLGS